MSVGLAITYNNSELSSSTPSSLLVRTRPHNRDSSSSNSSLTCENIRQHNALHSRDSPANPMRTGSSLSSKSSTKKSSRDLETTTETDNTPFPSPQESTELNPSAHICHVHFRPRVRIASGLSRNRYQQSPTIPISKSNFAYTTPDSSVSTSVSSSISAPLRSVSDDENDKPGWGPLGKRVALLSSRSGCRRQRRTEPPEPPDWLFDEHTPLLYPPIRSSINNVDMRSQGFPDNVYTPDQNQEFDDGQLSPKNKPAFGRLPQRLLNHEWWRWQLESLACCHWMDDEDNF